MAFGDLVQAIVVNENTTPGTSTSDSLPALATNGNLLIVGCFADKNSEPIVPPSGFSSVGASSGSINGISGICGWKISDGTEQLLEFTWANANLGTLVILEVEGPWESAPPVVSSTGNSGATGVTTLSTGNTSVPTVDENYCLAFYSTDSASALAFAGTTSWTNSFNEIYQTSVSSSAPGVVVANKVISSAAAQETTYTHDGANDQSLAIVLVFSAPDADEVGLASETDIAQGVSSAKVVPVGVAAESNLSQSISASRQSQVVQAIEADIGISTIPAKRGLVGLAEQADIALNVVISKFVGVDQSTELQTAQSINTLKNVAVGQVLENDTAFAVSNASATLVSVGLAAESGLAFPALAYKSILLGQAVESGVSRPITIQKRISVGLSVEGQVAQPLTVAKQSSISAASDFSLALPVTSDGTIFLPVGVAADNEAAQSVVVQKILQLGQGMESSTALQISSAMVMPVGLVSEVDISNPLSVSKSASILFALETNFALPLLNSGASEPLLPITLTMDYPDLTLTMDSGSLTLTMEA